MIYGYCRVSSYGQGAKGNSLEAQEKAVREAGATKIYKDVFTGTKSDRPSFTELLSEIKQGDTLIVTKLDRFARSVSQASGLITDLIDKGVTVNVLNLGILSNDSVSTLLRNVLLSFAQFERDMIVERTQEGKSIAKQRADFREGRPQKYSDKKLTEAVRLLDRMTYNEVVELTGISRATLARAKRKSQDQKAV